ncbi:MAG: transporter substrate-binding domain-containing protein, partial [Alphaproteobacteria bacterium]
MIAGVMLVGMTGAAWAQNADLASQSVIETIKERGVMRVGLDFFIPWAMRAKNGDLVGFEIDVATRVAQDMGVEIEFVPTAWDGIIPALMSGKFDVVIAGMSVTPERHLRINFTAPYASSGMLIAANSSTVPGLTRVSDFNDPNITIGAKRGTTGVDSVMKQAPLAKLRQYDEEVVGMQDAINGT